MALVIPLALKQLLGLPVDTPSTDGISTPKVFGPAINQQDQAAAEAADPAGTSAVIKPQANLPTNVPEALKKVAAPTEDVTPPAQSIPDKLSDVAGIASSKPTAEQLPSLAPQGSSHAIPQALLELMGIAGPQPKPGETYTGPMTLADKIKGGIGFAGKLGNAVAAASGTPEQKELAEKRAEFGPELQAKKDIAQAQIKSLGDYRQGELRNVEERNKINQQKADDANKIAVGKMALKGQVPDENDPGTFRFMTPDEVLAHPFLSKDLDLKTAAVNYKNMGTQLEQAKVAALNDPKSQTLQNKVRDLQIRWAMAQQQFAQRQHALSNQDASLAMRGREAMWQFGENPLNREQLTPDNAPPATMINGQPTPMKSSAFPTSTMRNIEAQANTAAEGIPGTIQEITRLKDKLGPVSGRWNDFMQGKIGMDDPEFAGLRSDLLMVSSAVALAHARGRLPENLREEFDHMINAPQQTPENIVSILSHIQPWMQRASHMSIPGGGGNGPAPTAPAAPANKVPSFADWKKTQGGQ